MRIGRVAWELSTAFSSSSSCRERNHCVADDLIMINEYSIVLKLEGWIYSFDILWAVVTVVEAVSFIWAGQYEHPS